MAKYIVNVTEKNYGSMTVEADTPHEAYALVDEMYANGDVNWGKTDLQVQSIKEE